LGWVFFGGIMGDISSLRELKVEINRACPLNCLHCSSDGAAGAPEQLDFETLSRLLREFANMGGEDVCISGGEPLLYPDLAEVIKDCRKLNVRASLYTSGVMFDNGLIKVISDEMINLLVANDVKVIFSIHGALERTHEALTRTRGSFDVTISAMEKALKANLVVETHIVPTALNFGELGSTIRLVSSLGIHKVSLLRFVPQGRGRLNSALLQLNEDQMRQLGQKIAELRQALPMTTIRTGAPYNILCPQKPAKCEAGISVLTVRPSGDIAPCDAFKRFVVLDDYDNIARKSLSEVWQKSLFINSIRSIKKLGSDSSCTACPIHDRCNSGCLAQKAISCGSLSNGRDPGCPLQRAYTKDAKQEAILV
jgi:radical SAM protein with 4Fe4S-binding SPASM domain